jgi:protein-disulfide isomerase
MSNLLKASHALFLFLSVASVGCHAQTPSESGGKLSPEAARRVEVMIRNKSEVPPDYVMSIGGRRESEVPGYDQIAVSFSASGTTSGPINFLLSADGKVLAQFNKFDISKDPKENVPPAERPARGGPENAPVLIVVFDDLECPFCAQMHAELFPAITNHYKSQVRIVYRDFPLVEIHPWAMRGAIDSNCLGTMSPAGYWNFVDYVHAHAAEIGGDAHSVAKASSQLDRLAEEEAARQHINLSELEACLKNQNDAQVKDSMKLGASIGIAATPTLFINGEKINGVTRIENIYRIIDEALVVAGQTPPPPVQPAASVNKPGN